MADDKDSSVSDDWCYDSTTTDESDNNESPPALCDTNYLLHLLWLVAPSSDSNLSETKESDNDSFESRGKAVTLTKSQPATNRKKITRKKKTYKADGTITLKKPKQKNKKTPQLPKDDANKKPKPQKKKKKTPQLSKAVSFGLTTSLTMPRPKRACTIPTTEIKNSSLWKLGKQAIGYWEVKVHCISLKHLQCSICDKFFCSIKLRKKHETLKHISLYESVYNPMNSVTTPENKTHSKEKLLFFNYLQLQLTSKNKTKSVNQLTKRTHLLKALKAQ